MTASAKNINLADYSEGVDHNLDRPFALSGRRAYLIGHMNGSFPDLGHHLPGEMGGLWVPPVKLADGWWFGLREASGTAEWQWLSDSHCQNFTMSPGKAKRTYELEVGTVKVGIEQEIFVAAEKPAFFSTLTLHNPNTQALSLDLAWLVRFDIRGAWWTDWPDRPDEARYDPLHGAIFARDSLTTGWGAMMQADRLPQEYSIGSDLWAWEKTGSLRGSDERPEGILRNPVELQGEGISGQLNYRLELAAQSYQTIHFVITGTDQFEEVTQLEALSLLAQRETLWKQKAELQTDLLARTPILSTPQPKYSRIFAGSSLCLDMLTLDLASVGTGIMAGLQGFAWFFGCDTYYSLSGLLISGQVQTGLETLKILARYGRNQRGRIPHEITQTGEMFNRGNQVETGEYVTSIERAFRWTGDRAFLAQVYPVCVTGIFDFLLKESDSEGTLLPEGPGILELRTAPRGRKLDVACSLYQGLVSLSYLAQVMDDQPTLQRSIQLVEQVRQKIEQHFWVAERGEYVWRIEKDLTISPDEVAHSYVTLEMGVVKDLVRATQLFETVESSKHTGPQGLILPGSTNFVMPIQNAILALAEFRYHRPDQGLRYLQFCAEVYGYYMPWAIPEFVGHDACFVQAWSSATFNWLAVQGFFRLQPDPLRNVIIVQPQLPSNWNFVEVKNLCIWDVYYNLRLERLLNRIEFHFQLVESEAIAARFEVVNNPDYPVDFV